MTELGDDYRFWKKAKQNKRWANLKWSTAYIKELGFPFESKSGGIHLIIDGPDCKIDFWPSTGKWIFRTGERGRGVKNLVNKIKEVNDAQIT